MFVGVVSLVPGGMTEGTVGTEHHTNENMSWFAFVAHPESHVQLLPDDVAFPYEPQSIVVLPSAGLYRSGGEGAGLKEGMVGVDPGGGGDEGGEEEVGLEQVF